MSEFVRICAKADLPPTGEAREIVVGDKVLCLANVDGGISAMDNICPHRGGPLGQGMIEGSKVICPWHAWAFDLRTGVCRADSSLRIRSYDVKVDDGIVLVDLESHRSRGSGVSDSIVEEVST